MLGRSPTWAPVLGILHTANNVGIIRGNILFPDPAASYVHMQPWTNFKPNFESTGTPADLFRILPSPKSSELALRHSINHNPPNEKKQSLDDNQSVSSN